MTISKEERAELRRQLGDEVPDHLWPDLPDHAIDLLDALDASDERISVLESENRRALELIDVGLAETGKWQKHCERAEDKLDAANARIAELEAEVARFRKLFDDAGQGEHNVLSLVEYYQECVIEAGDREDALKSRIAELEAAAQWRTMDTAPRDGTKILMSGRGPGGADSAVIQSADGAWLVMSERYSDEELGIGHPGVVMAWLPIPALPEGGAK